MICFGLEYRVSSKSEQVRCRNWNDSHVCQTMNFTCKNEVLIQNSRIWCTNEQVEIFMSNHEEICFDPKWSQFPEFWWKMQVQSRMGLSMSWEVQWRKSFSSLEKCVLSQSEKWWSEWKVEFLKHGSVSHFKILVCEWKFS